MKANSTPGLCQQEHSQEMGEAMTILYSTLRPHLEYCAFPPLHSCSIILQVFPKVSPPSRKGRRAQTPNHSLYQGRRDIKQGQGCFNAVEEEGMCFLLWVESCVSHLC